MSRRSPDSGRLARTGLRENPSVTQKHVVPKIPKVAMEASDTGVFKCM